MNILSPSLLSIDFNHIERNAKVLDEAGVKWFHFVISMHLRMQEQTC